SASTTATAGTPRLHMAPMRITCQATRHRRRGAAATPKAACAARACTTCCRACSAEPGAAGVFGLIARLRRNPRLPDPALWQAVSAATPWVVQLDPERNARLQQLVARFLADKTFTLIGGLELDDAQRMQLAALCCLPLLEFGAEGMRGWRELIVYPDAFRVNRSHVDAAGVLHEWDDELAGEAWE